MIEAAYYQKKENDIVQCLLCPRGCIIKNGQKGFCRVRENREGILYSLNYGLITAKNLDPIEKKPLRYFYPGKQILSIGTFGCNLHCQFCQNWEIAHKVESGREMTIDQLLQEMNDLGEENIGMAYTYNEPTVWFEYVRDLSRKVKAKGKKNVFVSNGYINSAPLSELMETIDAFNIDIKGFNEKFYKNYTKGSLQPVLDTCRKIREKGKHLEVTYLMIPEANDDLREFSQLVQWIETVLGKETPLHINRYFPAYKLTTPATSLGALRKAEKIALEKLSYVQVGNI